MRDVIGFMLIHSLALIGAVTACRWLEDWSASYRAAKPTPLPDTDTGGKS